MVIYPNIFITFCDFHLFIGAVWKCIHAEHSDTLTKIVAGFSDRVFLLRVYKVLLPYFAFQLATQMPSFRFCFCYVSAKVCFNFCISVGESNAKVKTRFFAFQWTIQMHSFIRMLCDDKCKSSQARFGSMGKVLLTFFCISCVTNKSQGIQIWLGGNRESLSTGLLQKSHCD